MSALKNLIAVLVLLVLATPASAGVVVKAKVVSRARPRVAARAVRVRVARPAPRVVVAAPAKVVKAAPATVDFDVDPEESRIIVDGRDRGAADDLDGSPAVLRLAPGTHRVRIETPGGKVVERTLELSAGSHVTVDPELD